MYKVLEVREYDEISRGHYGGNSGCGSFDVEKLHIFAVVCVNEDTGERERFAFYKGHEGKGLYGKAFYGYAGDYSLLIAGDRFKIEDTLTYPRISIFEE